MVLTGNTTGAGGQATAPGNGATLATLSPGIGSYFVRVQAVQRGTEDTANLTSVALFRGTTNVGAVIVGAGGVSESTFDQVRLAAGETLTLKTTAAFAAGAIVAVTLQASQIAAR